MVIKMKDGKLNTQIDFKGWCSREAPLKPVKEKNEDGSYPAVITTEAPAIVVDWERFEMVREILLMDGAILPENKQVPLLDSHSRFSTSAVKGSIRNLRTEGKELLGDVFFWSGAKEEESKVSEGHLTDLSAGYRTFEDKTIELRPGESEEINGRVFENNFGDKMRMLIRLAWEEKEGSLVAIGADKVSKFKSELQIDPSLFDKPGIKADNPQLQKKLDKIPYIIEINNQGNLSDTDLDGLAKKLLKNLKTKNEKLSITINERKNVMEKKELTPDELADLEVQRREGIEAIADQVKRIYKGSEDELKAVAKTAIKEKWSVDKFRSHVWDNVDFDKPLAVPDSKLDLTGKEIANYDIMNMVRYVLNKNDRATREAAAFEIECSEAIAKKVGTSPQGIYLPYDVQVGKTLRGLSKRDLTAGTAGTGGYLVGTDHRPDLFIEHLRNKMLTQRLGARMLRGLVGNVDIPKWTAGATALWAATESASMTESTPTTGTLALSPKDVGASVDISRRLLLQGTPDAGALVMDDIATILAIAIDLAVLHGTGSSGQPTGIAGTSGIGAVSGASYDWPAAVEHESDVDTANALEGTFAYVTTPGIKGMLKTRLKDAGVSGYLCEGNMMNGYPIPSTNQVSAGYIFFGNFAQLILAEWGNMDIYANKIERTGVSVITAITTVDVGVRQAGAFSVATSVN